MEGADGAAAEPGAAARDGQAPHAGGEPADRGRAVQPPHGAAPLELRGRAPAAGPGPRPRRALPGRRGAPRPRPARQGRRGVVRRCPEEQAAHGRRERGFRLHAGLQVEALEAQGRLGPWPERELVRARHVDPAGRQPRLPQREGRAGAHLLHPRRPGLRLHRGARRHGLVQAVGLPGGPPRKGRRRIRAVHVRGGVEGSPGPVGGAAPEVVGAARARLPAKLALAWAHLSWPL
mmetsp:Transcript_103956/g.282400  ORF Transcript_103956/g.282400 Transcript_103956/m.282400 type:complete len:234 (+) Transcript_103956:481-1182(+)